MNRTLATLVAILFAGSVAWAGELTPPKEQLGPPMPGAPTQPEGAPAKPEAGPEKPGAAAKEVEGKIKSLDKAKTRLTLEDGTILVIPDSLKASRATLKEGAMVKASFEEKGGMKVATSIEVRAEGKTPAGKPEQGMKEKGKEKEPKAY